MTTRKLTASEIEHRDQTATILAGLRLLQQAISTTDNIAQTVRTYHLEEIFGEEADPLTVNEIDDLCERINCGKEKLFQAQWGTDTATQKPAPKITGGPSAPIKTALVLLDGGLVAGVYTEYGYALAYESVDLKSDDFTLDTWEQSSDEMQALIRRDRPDLAEKYTGQIARRRAAIEELGEGPVNNGWEIPDQPEKFAVVEYQEGDAIWIYNVSTLDEAAKSILSSDTEKVDDTIVWDLDTDQQHRPQMAVTGWESSTVKK